LWRSIPCTPGLNKSQIARRLGVDRKTVRKYLAQDVDEFVKKPAKWPSILDPYKRYLQYRLEMLPELSAVRLYREISTLSCPGEKAPNSCLRSLTKALRGR